jgi:putative ABC transport system permease protein
MLRHYLTIALRSFRRAPFSKSVNIFALALGLTAFVAAYGVVQYWDHSERHFANASRTYVITADLEALDGSVRTGAQPQTSRIYADHLRADFPDFESVVRAQVMNEEGGIRAGDVNLRMFILGVEPGFLDIFDLPFASGDSPQALDEPNSIVLTQEAAMRLFGEQDPMGRTVTLGSVLDVTVTGVLDPIPEPSHMGRSATASLPFDVLVSWDTLDGIGDAVRARQARRNPQAAAAPPSPPAAATPPPENWLGNYCCTTYVTLKRESTLTPTTLNDQLLAFGMRHLPPQQAELAELRVGAVPVTDLMVQALNGQLFQGNGMSITLVLLALGGLVLIVACVNYANLATAQAARRAREVGLRKVLGAGTYRVMLQYLAEAALSTSAAAVVALVAIRLVAPVLRNALGIDLDLALFASLGFWAFLAALLVAVTVIGGAYPAFVLSRVPPVEALRIGRTKIGPRFAGTLLVGVQFAAASFLLIAVIVMYAQNLELKRTGLGAASDPLLVVANFPEFSGVDPVLLRDELERIPQVTAVADAGQLPWNEGVNIMLFGRTPDENERLAAAQQMAVGYDFFATLGYELLAGRNFDRARGEDATTGDMFDAQRTHHMVIDDDLARQLGFASPQEAIDQVIYLPERVTRAFGQAAQPVRIIGIVAKKPLSLRGEGTTANAYMLRPNLNFHIVRLAASDVSGGLAAIDALWKRLAPGSSPINRDFVDDLFNESYENFARINQVFAGLALVAVAIAIVGLFGMAVQVASRRVHEIGVRKSVGAQTRQVVAMLLRDFGKPVVVANLIAWPLGYLAAQQYLSVFMQRIPITPTPFVVSLGLALAVACAAVGGQALRAARTNPAVVLRSE